MTRRTLFARLPFVILLAILATAASASAEDAWAALEEPGAIVVMRHALAPGTGDPPGFTLGDCSTQRNLDAQGRAQARAIGEALREKGARFDRVMTSQWCRSRETAELLGVGEVEPLAALNSFFRDRSSRAAQTAATEDWLRALPEGSRAVLVSHQVNVTALTGVYPSSGEFVVGFMGPDGFVPRGEILIRP